MYYKTNTKGNPYIVLLIASLFLTLMTSSITLENTISPWISVLFPSSLIIGFIIGSAVLSLYKNFIFRDPDNEPFITGLLIILSLILLTFSAETILNRIINLKPPEIREVEINYAKQWVSVSRSSKGGSSRSYNAIINLKGWEGLNKDSITLDIKYGTADFYKTGYYASVVVRTGLFNIQYIPKKEIKPTFKEVIKEEIVTKEKEESYKDNKEKKNFLNNKKNLRFNNTLLNPRLKSETEEERNKRVFYDPKSPDFGKKKLPKEVYQGLDEKDKDRYKEIRRKLVNNRKEAQKNKPKLIGY